MLRSSPLNYVAGLPYYYARNYGKAIECCGKALDLDPNFFPAQHLMGLAHLQEGRFSDAINQLEDAKKLSLATPLWLVAITINEAKMRRRKDRRHLYVSLENPYGRTGDESSPFKVEDARPIASDLIEFGQLRRILICALNELQPEYRDVLRLRDITGANIREIAKILGITESNVKTRLLRARRKMRETLCALRGGGQSETVSRPIRSRHLQIRDAQASGFDGTRRRGRSYKQFRPCLDSDGF